MIRVADLKKSYGETRALRGVSFEVAEGEIIGLLGPNGAGKSTIIKTLTGYLQPDAGDVEIDKLDVLSHTMETQAMIGYLPENAPLYPELTVFEYLKMMGDLRQIDKDDMRVYLAEAIYATGLQNHYNRPISQLSKGYRQRVGLAQAILHKPRLLILDEPTVGLDPTQIVEIRNLIRRLSQNSTVLFSTHILPEVEALCDRVLMLINGRIRLDSRLADISLTNDVMLTLEESGNHIPKALRKVKGVSDVLTLDNVPHLKEGYMALRLVGDSDKDVIPAVYEMAVENNWKIRELRPEIQTLESVFNQLALSADPSDFDEDAEDIDLNDEADEAFESATEGV